MGTDPGSWRDQAACRGTGPARFYELHPAAIDAAKQVCASCPVRSCCLAHAVAAGEEHGVWGGLAAYERPPPPPRPVSGPGPLPRVGDDELHDLFSHADPDRPALDQLLEHVRLPAATAYRTLGQAVRLGVVERRGRALYPRR